MAEHYRTIAQIIANAWADQDWQGKLTAAGSDRKQINAILREKGMELPEIPDFPEDGMIQFVANTDRIRYVVIPTRPNLTDEDVGLFVRLRQIDSGACDCRTGRATLVDEIKRVLFGK